MTATKQWVPNELLKSADLNSNFGLVAQGFMTGVLCPSGPAVTIAANGTAELTMGTPAGANDVGGYFVAGPPPRVVIPAGLGGLYLVSLAVNAAAGGTAGDYASILSSGASQPLAHQFARRGSAASSQVVSWVANLSAGASIFVNATSLVSGADYTLFMLRVIRLASFGVFA